MLETQLIPFGQDLRRHRPFIQAHKHNRLPNKYRHPFHIVVSRSNSSHVDSIFTSIEYLDRGEYGFSPVDSNDVFDFGVGMPKATKK